MSLRSMSICEYMCAVYLKIDKKADCDKYHMNSIDDDSGAQIWLEFCFIIFSFLPKCSFKISERKFSKRVMNGFANL